VRAVLSSCSLPLDYVDALAALQDPSSHPGLSQPAGVSPNDHFSQTVKSTILERFYGFSAHDRPHIRVRRMARDTLRLLVVLLAIVGLFLLHDAMLLDNDAVCSLAFSFCFAIAFTIIDVT